MSKMSDFESKKKIAFVTNNLKTGGVQISLLNLIREIHNKYEVTLISFCDAGVSDAMLPNDVKLIVLKSPFQYFGIGQGELKHQASRYVTRAFWAALTGLFGRSFTIKIMSPFQRKLGDYDCAISYLHEGPQKNFYGGCNEFVLMKIKAKKKIAWLHCDFALCGANSKASERIYRRFDEIIACSEGARQSFLRCMPPFEDKCIAIRNCNDYECIRLLAGNGIPYDQSEFNIVTVARLSAEKGIERALAAVKQCADAGYKVHYHIVGSGDCENSLKHLTEEYGLTDKVTFYGNQKNPYPYIKNADLFLLPSYHEAAPMVFDEAACLGVPILSTATTSTDEMITKEHSGVVCDNSQNGLIISLQNLLNDPHQLADIRKALVGRIFDNKASICLFDNIVN